MTSSKTENIDEIPESYQEYIVTIYRLSSGTKKVTNVDIAKTMGIAPSSVYNMLKKLAQKKYIKWEPKQKEILLTPEGKLIGKQLILGHLIMELFLREFLGITDDSVTHKLACKLEHHVTGPIHKGFRNKIGEESYKKLERIVENDTDPEETIKKIKEVFPTPLRIIEEFSSLLSEKLPDSKNVIESTKNEFRKSF
ncbi:MAG: metal-dependent transcriptional regulator [Promethearchaeota archaeon]|nr:MAG: metal-dependent transcriptional regulator [Candidatus Lokiarchaeota archaeon]